MRSNPPLVLGYDPDTKDSVLLQDKDRYASTYVLGNTGTGKSGFLQTLIHQDIAAGNAVIVLDPHGDLANNCIAELPPNRVATTYSLDMEDEAYPFGLNIFAEAGTFTTEVERSAAVQRIYHVFDVLWPEIDGQQYLPTLLHNTTAVFLDNPGLTLVDMMRFFRQTPESKAFRAQLLAHVQDKTIQEDFQTEFDPLTPKEQKTIVAPLMRRLRSLFVGRSLIRNILGQPVTSINFRRAIERRETLFIKLPTTEMKEDASLIGMFIMAEITAAIFSFRDTPPDKRPGVSLYVDEFQNFATKDFDRIITEARKFGVRLTIAHQYRDQIKGKDGADLKKSTTTVSTKICFRVSGEDGREMAQYFPATVEETLEPDPRATRYLLEKSSSNRYAKELAEVYLRPIQERGGKWIEILDDGWSAGKVFKLASPFGTPKKPQKVKAPNPLPYLDDLFRKVMESGNYNLDIPVEAVLGFSNTTYHGFYQEALRANVKLTSAVIFPLVVDGGNGPEWIRRPQDGHEQFLHLLWLIRETMAFLAQHPVGKSTGSKAESVADMLTRLPKRAAFVRSGETISAMYTHNTPPALSGEALERRIIDIRDRTRTKYCHPTAAAAAAAQPSISDADPEPVMDSLTDSPVYTGDADGTSGIFHLRRADADTLDETIRVRGNSTNNPPVAPQPQPPLQPRAPQQPHLRRQWQDVDP